MNTSLRRAAIALGLLAMITGCRDLSHYSLPSKPVNSLIVGGGSSHDFTRWFNQADAATLQTAASGSITYVDQPDRILALLPNIDVLYLSNNQPLPAALHQAILDFEGIGYGLLLVHPALWYNWKDWPEYNHLLVGGGARSHDRYGEFEVTLVDPNHPVMAGVPGKFRITDELYHFERDPDGSPIHVLAEGRNLTTGKSYPVVWTVDRPPGRIVCISLGHDGKAHEHPAYQAMLRNSLRWLGPR